MPVIGGWTRDLSNWWGVDPHEPKPRVIEMRRLLSSLEALAEARTRLGDTVTIRDDVKLWDAHYALWQLAILDGDIHAHDLATRRAIARIAA